MRSGSWSPVTGTRRGRFEVVAFSRAHDLLTRLGGPIPRRMQARASEHYLQGMRAFVA